MKLWRELRLSESRVNSFVNGQTRAIYAIALVLFAAFSLASCSSDDDSDNPEKWVCILPPDWGLPVFTLDADSVPHFRHFTPYSADDFEKQVKGHGWHCNALQLINNDGSFSNDNLLGQLSGLGPTHYYFGESKLTKFIYVDHLGYKNGGMMYVERDYNYDESTSCVMSENQVEWQWFSTFPDKYIYAIYQLGVKSNGTPIYCIMTLQRMTDKELAAIRQQYSVNYDEEVNN